MGNKSKRILSIATAALCLSAAFSFTACGDTAYKGDQLDGYKSDAAVASNGGFAVEKGDYVYFVNGTEENTADNTYGDVVKAALMRISKKDLEEKNFSSVKTVVPSLFVEYNLKSGIYIYGDYVYYATPTTDKSMQGEVEDGYLDFKRAKIDGTAAPEKGYLVRLADNSSNYRFVEVDGVVYLLYEEGSALKSYNVSTGKTTVLVKDSVSGFVYDESNLESGNVYYTMNVTPGIDTENSSTPDYNQLYCVNVATTATTDAAKASYTTSTGKTYDFDEAFMKKANKEAKENDEDEPYDLSDYSTYPYVNLGTLVFDGVGVNSKVDERFNWNGNSEAFTPDGYKYSIKRHANDGIYFTREDVNKTNSDMENAKLYYLSNAKITAGWNAVKGNEAANLEVVALNANAFSDAIYLHNENKHEYVYVASDGTLVKESLNGKVVMAHGVNAEAKLMKTVGDYLYYYETGTNANTLSRINYTGDADAYNALLNNEEYKPFTFDYLTYCSVWYNPEFIGNTMLFSSGITYNSTKNYFYVYATTLGDTAALNTVNEAYNDVKDYIDGFSVNKDLQNAMNYYFATGDKVAFEEVKDLYDEYQIEKFNEFVSKVEGGEYKKEADFVQLVSKMKDSDAEEIEESIGDYLREEKEEVVEEKGLPTWAIVLIVVGGVLIVAAAVVVSVVIVSKKKAAKAEAEATVNAYKNKKKIDTTDDKSIDVYADEEATEETVEEEAEEIVEEVEEAVEEPVEEAAEAPSEE